MNKQNNQSSNSTYSNRDNGYNPNEAFNNDQDRESH